MNIEEIKNIYHRQNTGCKDINGKFIHEGDIVKCKHESWCSLEPTIGKVVYSSNYAGYMLEMPAPLEPYAHCEYFHRYKIEIIGNVDNNPNLYKKGNEY